MRARIRIMRSTNNACINTAGLAELKYQITCRWCALGSLAVSVSEGGLAKKHEHESYTYNLSACVA